MSPNTDPVRLRMAEANPAPTGAEPPGDVMASEVLLAVIEQRSGEMEQKTRTREGTVSRGTPPRHRSRGWLAAAAAFVIVLLVGAATTLWPSSSGDPAIDPATPATTAAPPPPAVTPAPEAWQRVGSEVMDPVVGLFDMTTAASGLVAVGFDPGAEDQRQNGVIFASEDGITWARLAEDDPALTVGAVFGYGITEGGPGLVVVGMGCEDDTAPCAAHPTVWTSDDGTTWTRSAADPAVFGERGAMLDVVATEYGLVAAGAIQEFGEDDTILARPAVWRSADGADWSRVWEGDVFDQGESFFPGFNALTVGADGLIVGVGWAENDFGEFVAAVWVSADGVSWEQVGRNSLEFGSEAGNEVAMLDIAAGSDGYIATGTDGGSEVAIWRSPDGRTWTRIDTTGQPFAGTGSLSSVAPLGTGYVAAGPHGFVDQSGSPVMLWTSPDGVTWDLVHAIGSGYAQTIVTYGGGLAVAGAMPADDDYHAAVWIGPSFDPDVPPPAPTFTSPPVEEAASGGADEQAGGDGQDGVDPMSVDAAAVEPGDPDVAPPSDGFVTLGTAPLPLGERSELPDTSRFDFLAGACEADGCWRDPVMVHPDDDQTGVSGIWVADAAFHIRHGFVNEADAPLGDEYQVVLFVEREEGPELDSGVFELGQTYRVTADYVMQGTTTKCGPGYWEQTSEQTCEWSVWDFPDGLPGGRYNIWVGWYAPCPAWQEFGPSDTCPVVDDYTTWFSTATNMPFYADTYPEDTEPPFDAATFFAENTEPIVRGWPTN